MSKKSVFFESKLGFGTNIYAHAKISSKESFATRVYSLLTKDELAIAEDVGYKFNTLLLTQDIIFRALQRQPHAVGQVASSTAVDRVTFTLYSTRTPGEHGPRTIIAQRTFKYADLETVCEMAREVQASYDLVKAKLPRRPEGKRENKADRGGRKPDPLNQLISAVVPQNPNAIDGCPSYEETWKS